MRSNYWFRVVLMSSMVSLFSIATQASGRPSSSGNSQPNYNLVPRGPAFHAQMRLMFEATTWALISQALEAERRLGAFLSPTQNQNALAPASTTSRAMPDLMSLLSGLVTMTPIMGDLVEFSLPVGLIMMRGNMMILYTKLVFSMRQ